MQPVVKLSPIKFISAFNIRYTDPNKINDEQKIIKISSCFNPDIHCGFIDGGNKPCLKSLDCKIHPVPLKSMVTGRSKVYDIILSNHLEEQKRSTGKPIVKQIIKKARVHNKEELILGNISAIPNVPPNLDNNINTSVNCENNCDQVPKIVVSTKENIEENRKLVDII